MRRVELTWETWRAIIAVLLNVSGVIHDLKAPRPERIFGSLSPEVLEERRQVEQARKRRGS